MRIVFFILLFTTLIFAQDKTSSNVKADPIIGTHIYEFETITLDGDTIKASDFKEKVFLINIWDTVCPPCIAEFPGFIDLYNKYQKEGFEILGMTYSLYEDEEGLKKFILKHELNFPIAKVNRALVENLGGTKGIPTTYIVDKQGTIKFRYFGYLSKDVLEKDICLLLGI